MKVIDPGHIYQLDHCADHMRFVKRSGGAITYPKEWFGLQTQAVMRAMIHHLQMLQVDEDYVHTYRCWQLGDSRPQAVHFSNVHSIIDVAEVLVDRSQYLNAIIPCVETGDAIQWLVGCQHWLQGDDRNFKESRDCVRHALWSYEARAYRRKVEGLNRKRPEHDDTERPRAWRPLICEDVPFTEENIELRPIGIDGHIVLL